MEENKELSIVSPQEELESRLMEESDTEELKKIINLFNLNIKKKDILRVGKLSELQDNVVNEMILRIEQAPGAISNDSLINFYKTVQSTIDKSDRSLNDIDTSSIQINQQQINLNVTPELDTGSKMRIAEAVKSVLEKINKTKEQEVEVIDAESENIEQQ